LGRSGPIAIVPTLSVGWGPRRGAVLRASRTCSGALVATAIALPSGSHRLRLERAVALSRAGRLAVEVLGRAAHLTFAGEFQ